MLEESRMDKKSINRSQPQSRVSAIDCKKNSESTCKQWPRNSKKREGSGTAPKNEPYRKNGTAQRGRAQDKRPRPRGGASNFTLGGAQGAGQKYRLEEDEEPEIGSVFVPGSKKQNLNHLLNFMYPSRGSDRGAPERRGPPPRRPPPRCLNRLNHDLYLRANCQFVMQEGSDFKLNLLDPDVPVNWQQVEEIVVRSTGRSECPICLGAPAAGRVGLCGHVYCWACVLHYAAGHDKQPPPCPVCAMPLIVNDMKPTRMVQWNAPAEEMTMRLVRRLRGSTTVEVAPPRGVTAAEAPPAVLPVGSIGLAPYAKFFAASKQEVCDILNRERKEIKDQIMAEIDTSEIEYLEKALEMLKVKEEKINTQYEQPKIVEAEEEMFTVVYEYMKENSKKIDWFDVTEDGQACDDNGNIQDQVEELAIGLAQSTLNADAPVFQTELEDQPEEFPLTEPIPEMVIEEQNNDKNLTDLDKQNQAKYFYFYQAEDGQQVFLSSLNVRMLTASWSALAAAPALIRGRVLHRDTMPLIEQTRKHMPFTAHLPLYCSFDVVELDLQPPYVTAEAIHSYADELDRRARTRARQEREERRRERAYRRTMEGPPRPDFSSELMFPPAPPSYGSPPTKPPLRETPLAAESPTTSGASPRGPSFAKMASASGTWRVRQSAPAPAPPPEDPDEAAAPRALSLSDAIEAALQAAPAAAGKKKKNKQKVLFATGMHRAD